MSDNDRYDDEDWYDDGDADAIPCPECGAELYDDADHCPHCGYWLSEADQRAASPSLAESKTVRIVAVGLLVMLLISLLLFGSIF